MSSSFKIHVLTPSPLRPDPLTLEVDAGDTIGQLLAKILMSFDIVDTFGLVLLEGFGWLLVQFCFPFIAWIYNYFNFNFVNAIIALLVGFEWLSSLGADATSIEQDAAVDLNSNWNERNEQLFWTTVVLAALGIYQSFRWFKDAVNWLRQKCIGAVPMGASQVAQAQGT